LTDDLRLKKKKKEKKGDPPSTRLFHFKSSHPAPVRISGRKRNAEYKTSRPQILRSPRFHILRGGAPEPGQPYSLAPSFFGRGKGHFGYKIGDYLPPRMQRAEKGRKPLECDKKGGKEGFFFVDLNITSCKSQPDRLGKKEKEEKKEKKKEGPKIVPPMTFQAMGLPQKKSQFEESFF